MIIRKYDPLNDLIELTDLIRSEGDEWSCYSSDAAIGKYKITLEKSICYVAVQNGMIVGFSRSIEDPGFYIYICDLLVHKDYRGKSTGMKLMECLSDAYPEHTIYVMSDVDEYYKKLGYEKEGSIFRVI